VVRRIIQEATTPVMVGDTVVRIRGSIGIALSGPGEVGLDELIHRADVAMYRAKADSRATGASGFARYDAAHDAEDGYDSSSRPYQSSGDATPGRA
jgi:GGDEF domain-containing protein